MCSRRSTVVFSSNADAAPPRAARGHRQSTFRANAPPPPGLLRSSVGRVGVTCVLVIVSAVAAAQTSAPAAPAPVAEIEEIVGTGSRLPHANQESVSPVTVVSGEEVK